MSFHGKFSFNRQDREYTKIKNMIMTMPVGKGDSIGRYFVYGYISVGYFNGQLFHRCIISNIVTL